MSAPVPNRHLFKFEFPLRYCTKQLAMKGDSSAWDEEFRLPPLCTIDNQEPFADIFSAWNETGLFIGVTVSGKRRSPHCDPERFRSSDALRVMTDMRDTRNIRRATRFCQQFYFMPSGGGKNRKEPLASSAPVARAQSDAPLAKSGEILIASKVVKDGYSLTAHIPANALAGFDPVENPRIGFFAILEDTELGHQSLTVDDDLNWWCDPSTWPTAVLSK